VPLKRQASFAFAFEPIEHSYFPITILLLELSYSLELSSFLELYLNWHLSKLKAGFNFSPIFPINPAQPAPYKGRLPFPLIS
jgi:hypothetical protein